MEKIATREAYGNTLAKLGEENQKIVVLDADLSKSTMSYKFAEKFPERFFQCGVAEANMIGMAAGLANSGKIPFASTFAVFATGRVWDQIRVSVAYSRSNVKIAGTHAGITVGEDGATHQCLEDIALMRVIPGMTVLVPADGVETEQVVRAAAEYVGPVYIRLGRLPTPIIYNNEYKFKIGKANLLKEGKDVTIIACGTMVYEALQSAEILAKEKITASIINMSTIKPLDKETIIESARKTGAVVTAEEHNIIGGLGGAVSEVLAENVPVPMKRIGINDSFGESGKPAELLKKYKLTAEDIADACKEVIGVKKRLR